jgi:hypothetical protein
MRKYLRVRHSIACFITEKMYNPKDNIQRN